MICGIERKTDSPAEARSKKNMRRKNIRRRMVYIDIVLFRLLLRSGFNCVDFFRQTRHFSGCVIAMNNSLTRCFIELDLSRFESFQRAARVFIFSLLQNQFNTRSHGRFDMTILLVFFQVLLMSFHRLSIFLRQSLLPLSILVLK